MHVDPNIQLLTHLEFYIQSHHEGVGCYIDFQCTQKYPVEVHLGYDRFFDWYDFSLDIKKSFHNKHYQKGIPF